MCTPPLTISKYERPTPPNWGEMDLKEKTKWLEDKSRGTSPSDGGGYGGFGDGWGLMGGLIMGGLLGDSDDSER